MVTSIGECKENSKPEEYLTAEDQQQQQKTRDRVGGSERMIGGSNVNQLISEEQVN